MRTRKVAPPQRQPNSRLNPQWSESARSATSSIEAQFDKHPHRPFRGVPVRVEPDTLRSLSRIRLQRALGAVLGDWFIIGAAIGTCELLLCHPLAVVAAVFLIGSRQHALAIVVHDAVHYRFLPNKKWNDWVANLLAAWPTFIEVELFRSVHALHHRYLGERTDGNRVAWATHDQKGQITSEWEYPKSRSGLVLKLMRRSAVITGLCWIRRGLRAPLILQWPHWKSSVFFGYYVIAIVTLLAFGLGLKALMYWAVPYCTWHIAAQYIRLICEHSGHIADDRDFNGTRSTLPGMLGSFFILPHNVGYHIEHHWYPSVPWYNLPALHGALSEAPLFSKANVQRSISAALRQCVADHSSRFLASLRQPQSERSH